MSLRAAAAPPLKLRSTGPPTRRYARHTWNVDPFISCEMSSTVSSLRNGVHATWHGLQLQIQRFRGFVIRLQCTMSSSTPGAGLHQLSFLSPASFVLFLSTNMLSQASRSAFVVSNGSGGRSRVVFGDLRFSSTRDHGINRTFFFLGVVDACGRNLILSSAPQHPTNR